MVGLTLLTVPAFACAEVITGTAGGRGAGRCQ
jgi:hypothetical protein